jgi:hypothetical protein
VSLAARAVLPLVAVVLLTSGADARKRGITGLFEGYGTNTAKAALSSALGHGVDVPVGHDGGPHRSRTMARYRSGGTPWFVVIDRQGIVRFDGFRITVPKVTALLERLLKPLAQK